MFWFRLGVGVSGEVCYFAAVFFCFWVFGFVAVSVFFCKTSSFCESWVFIFYGFYVGKGFRGMVWFCRVMCFYRVFIFYIRAVWFSTVFI